MIMKLSVYGDYASCWQKKLCALSGKPMRFTMSEEELLYRATKLETVRS